MVDLDPSFGSVPTSVPKAAREIMPKLQIADSSCGLRSVFSVEGLMWFQNDMLGFLEEVAEAAVTFLESIPGEEQTAR